MAGLLVPGPNELNIHLGTLKVSEASRTLSLIEKDNDFMNWPQRTLGNVVQQSTVAVELKDRRL